MMIKGSLLLSAPIVKHFRAKKKLSPVCFGQKFDGFLGINRGLIRESQKKGTIQWKMANFDPSHTHRIETHELTATKFRTIDYVRERTP